MSECVIEVLKEDPNIQPNIYLKETSSRRKTYHLDLVVV